MVTIDPDGNLWQHQSNEVKQVGPDKKWRHAQAVHGGEIVAISDDDGQVYHLTPDKFIPVLRQPTASLACGLEHCVAVTREGRAFTAALTSWAYERGQLGLGEHRHETPSTPPKLSELDSWSLMKGGAVQREAKEVSLRIKCEDVFFRELLPCNAKFVEAHCGDNHSVLLDGEGGVWVFGCNEQQQLGMGNSLATCVSKPHRHDLQAEMVAAGGSNSLVYTKQGDLLVVGAGLQGQLGNGHRRHQRGEWQPIPSLSRRFNPDGSLIKPAQMAVGGDHLGVLMETAEPQAGFGYDLRLWGGNQAGQLGTGKRVPSCEPISPAPIESLICRGGQVQIGQGQDGKPEYQLYLGPQLTILH